MQVHELLETAAGIAGLASSDIVLMRGEELLPSDGVLGDYIIPSDARGTIISVVSSVGVRNNGVTPPEPRPLTVTGQSRSPGSVASSTSDVVPMVFLINLVHADGTIVQHPVTPTMLVRQVRDQVATSSIGLAYQQNLLVMDRQLMDHPPIERNAYVYVLLGMRPTTVPPSSGGPLFPPTHGPELGPGFARSQEEVQDHLMALSTATYSWS
jgi:hypothetical protein